MKRMITVPCQQSTNPKRGSILVITLVFLIGLIGFAALVIDVGTAYSERLKLQGATDIAAMAAIVDWAAGNGSATTIQVATDFGKTNGVRASEITVQPGLWEHATRKFTAAGVLPSSYPAGTVPAVRVGASRVVGTPFARVIGNNNLTPQVQSIAIAAQATAVAGALPWAVCDGGVYVPVKCTALTIKNGNDCTGPGNFGALALGGTGASNYRNNIEFGYSGVLHVGDVVDTETGNMVGPTKQGLDSRLQGLPPHNCTASSGPPGNKRLGFVPVVNNLDVNGRKPVTITGFWAVALDDAPGGGKVTGVFLYSFGGTEIDPSKAPIVGMVSGTALVK